MDGQTQTASREYVISGEESERIRILKIWFTVMVVFIHSYTEEVHFTEGTLVLNVPVWLDWMKYLLSQVVAQCAVPGYFIMSAIFLYRKDFTWVGNLRRKVKSLLVPYLLINSIWIVIFFAAQHIHAFGPYFSKAGNNVANWTIMDYLNAYIGIDRPENNPLVYPLWFMRDLMVLNVLAVVIKMVIDKFPRLIFLLLMAVMLFGVDLHIPILRRDALVFFPLGYYFVKYDIHISDVDKLDPVLLTGFYGISVTLFCMLRDMPQQQIVRPFAIMLGGAFYMRFATKAARPGWKQKLLALSGYALPVYLFHEMNLTILQKIMARLLPTTTFFQVVGYFGIPAVIIALCLAGSWLLKRWAPRLYAALTGGRTM